MKYIRLRLGVSPEIHNIKYQINQEISGEISKEKQSVVKYKPSNNKRLENDLQENASCGCWYHFTMFFETSH